MATPLQRLADWYLRQCDGEWEHGFGISIESVDNPGLMLKVNVSETHLRGVPYAGRRENIESADRWLDCLLRDGEFIGACAAGRIDEVIEEFLRWAEEHKPQS